MALHPLNVTEAIRDAYIRYLKTIKPFQDSELRREFAQALETPGRLVKGPILEIAPPFRMGKSLRGLVEEGVLSPRFAALCRDNEALPYERPLYVHQERAIRKAVAGRNIVVSTGTGSGKTEAFLVPILNALLREEEEGTLSQPGVRALLLYPMNALANDQMKRLRRLLARYPAITFGRYIGETQHERERALRYFKENYPDEPDIENELKSREEMQATPPHILLTNYAMLEYLLLRPDDSPLFDGPTGQHWRFIVLDEAHVYNGANATEIAMLLRRLQDRVAWRHGKQLQAFATSATLGGGRADFPNVATFASDLFSVPFEWVEDDPDRQDIIEAEHVPLSALGETWGEASKSLYTRLHELAEEWRSTPDADRPRFLSALESMSPAPEVPRQVWQDALAFAREQPNESVPRFLYRVLRGEGRLRAVREYLDQHGPTQLSTLASKLFGGDAEVLISLVSAAILARPRAQDAPLLPARYHVFARALEGAFVCLNRDADVHQGEDAKPRLFLSRHKRCPHCGSRVFELANCTQCGTAYLIGKVEDGREAKGEQDVLPGVEYLFQDSRLYIEEVAQRVDYFVLQPRSVPVDEDALAEEGDVGLADETKVEEMRLCPRCGAVYDPSEPRRCQCEESLLPIFQVRESRAPTVLQRCVSCSTLSKQGVVYRFLTGQNAPVGILAQTLYQYVPPAREENARSYPGQGRKMLIFTDNRQDAAFFAAYLEWRNSRNLRRRLIVKTLTEAAARGASDLRLTDVLPRLLIQAERAHVFREEQSADERRRWAATWLMQEFLAFDRRISLEGVGLVQFRPVEPDWTLPPFLAEPPLELEREEAFHLIWALLNTLRQRGVTTYLLQEEVDLLTDRREEFEPRDRPGYVREQGGTRSARYQIFGWVPSDGYSNARLDILRRLIRSRVPEHIMNDEEVDRYGRRLLHELWEYLTGNGSPWQGYFVRENLAKEGTVYRLKHEMWAVHPTQDDALTGWWGCQRCQSITPTNVGNVCPTYGCDGHLVPLHTQQEVLRANLYRHMYLYSSPAAMRVEEHTAQWKPKKAAQVQNEFIRGEVNVLSCSTTFELGVDVGELQAVVLRNVPPTTANYVQRAGRAGRRADSAAFVLTFAQRRSHDFTFYAEPERMVAGHIRPPTVVLENAKIIRRHMHSVLMAAFFRWAKETHGVTYRDVGQFFAPKDRPPGTDLLREYIATRPAEVYEALDRILPKDEMLRRELNFDTDWIWVSCLVGGGDSEGVLELAELKTVSEIKMFADLAAQAASKETTQGYREAMRFTQIQNTLRKRDLLGYLGTHNVLPKYGFPTDVVELKTDHLNIGEAQDLDLSRDLRIAISEYAPGAEIVAAKKIWKSIGLRKLPQREWMRYEYAICPECERFNYAVEENLPTTCTCGTPLQERGRRQVFVVPEYGFVAGKETKRAREELPLRFHASRVYFASYALPGQDGTQAEALDPEQVLDPAFSSGVWKRYSRYGWLAVVNKAMRGFRVCTVCGYAEPAFMGRSRRRRSSHNDPITGRECTGTVETFHLGHLFMTDVLELSFEVYFGGVEAILSVLYALLDGASDALDIQRNDINGTFYYRAGGQPPSFILFDDVPGGAGHVRRIYDNLRPAVEAALKRLERCECGWDTSCYNCLRNYQNQWAHDLLQRGVAIDVLRDVLK